MSNVTTGVNTAIAAMFLSAAAPCALSHGARHNVSDGGTVVTATYDNGNPMAFCDVTVFAPGDAEKPYQKGTSDRNGRFAFLPDTNGTWKVHVDDGMGHSVKVEVDIDRDGVRSVRKPHHEHHNHLGGTAVGIAAILGCFGLYVVFARRVRRRSDTGEAKA